MSIGWLNEPGGVSWTLRRRGWKLFCWCKLLWKLNCWNCDTLSAFWNDCS